MLKFVCSLQEIQLYTAMYVVRYIVVISDVDSMGSLKTIVASIN